MAREHHFEAVLRWVGSSETAGTHTIDLEGRPSFEVAAAPQYQGDPTKPNPEELFLASLVSCQMLTFLSLARAQKIDVRRYVDRARATLSMKEKRMRITEVRLRPVIELAGGVDASGGEALVDRAHELCFIASSVSCDVVIEPEIVVAA